MTEPIVFPDHCKVAVQATANRNVLDAEVKRIKQKEPHLYEALLAAIDEMISNLRRSGVTKPAERLIAEGFTVIALRTYLALNYATLDLWWEVGDMRRSLEAGGKPPRRKRSTAQSDRGVQKPESPPEQRASEGPGSQDPTDDSWL